MRDIKVSDIMIFLDEYPAIALNTATIHDAIETLFNAQIDIGGRKSLPRILIIINREDEIMGMVRRRDIFRGLQPQFIVDSHLQYQSQHFDIQIDRNLAELSFENMLMHLSDRAQKPVADVMFSDIYTINYDDHVFTALHVMVRHNITILPVMNKSKVVGIVRSVELFEVIAKSLLGKDHGIDDETNAQADIDGDK
ncbi:HPP family protein [candidate division KSB1 bacterium]